MKRIIKYIGFFLLAMLGLFMILVILIIFSAFSSENNRGSKSNSGNIIVEFQGKEMPELEKKVPVFADSMEEALAVVNHELYFGDDKYIDQVSYTIKVFENDKYSTMFYLSDKNSKEGAFVGAKFIVKTTNSKKQYALLYTMRMEYGDHGKNKMTPEKEFSLFCQYIQAFDIGNLSKYGINEGDRFIFGGIDTVDVNRLKIEGQSPTEIIEFSLYGEKNYFWYYENLISDKPSSEFDIEIEEK